jgi:archaeal flagellar protein FlaI
MVSYRRFGGGRFGVPEVRLSVLDLYNSGTLDFKLAALLWLLMENKASVLVAAGPSFAGKTTLLNVMLDFLPPKYKEIHLQGMFEDFSFLQNKNPSDSYLVAAEFSGDLYEYMWGEGAQKAFQLLNEGWAMGGTVHARSPQETLYLLHDYLAIPPSTLGRIDAIVTLRATRGRDRYSEPIRRIDSVSLVIPQDNGLLIEMMVSRELGTDQLVFTGELEMQTVLGKKFKMDQVVVAKEIDTRGRFLARLLTTGKLSRDEVRRAIINFYRSTSTDRA